MVHTNTNINIYIAVNFVLHSHACLSFGQNGNTIPKLFKQVSKHLKLYLFITIQHNSTLINLNYHLYPYKVKQMIVFLKG